MNQCFERVGRMNVEYAHKNGHLLAPTGWTKEQTDKKIWTGKYEEGIQVIL